MQYSLAFAALVATACASSLADNTENTFHGQLLPVKKLLRSPTLPACAHQTLPRPFHLAKNHQHRGTVSSQRHNLTQLYRAPRMHVWW